MKIAQINTTYGITDSTGRNVKELHNYFERNGYESRVYVTRINNETEKNDPGIVFFSNAFDGKIHALLSRMTGLQGYFSYFATIKLIKSLKEYAPDVILLNVLHSNCINFNLFYEYVSKLEVPIIFVLHDCFFFTGHCCHYIDVQCEKWKNECGGCPSMKKWNKSLFFDTSRKSLADKKKWYDRIRIKGVIAVSHWLEEEAKQSILHKAQITTIYNWVDQNVFKPNINISSEWNKFYGKKIALAVASFWGEDKGLQEIQQLAVECPNLEIIMVGGNIKEAENIKNIHAIGTVHSAEKLAELYARADVFLNPSKMETFGKTTAEALSCGTPVVAYRTTACMELIDNTRGALARLGDVDDYIEKAKYVLEKGKTYYSEASVKFAQENFNSMVNMQQYVDVINALIKEK